MMAKNQIIDISNQQLICEDPMEITPAEEKALRGAARSIVERFIKGDLTAKDVKKAKREN